MSTLRNEPYGLYKILNLDKSASMSDIKKQYRKLAMKWHPDKNMDNAEEATLKFQDVGYAYEILSDPSKKKQYDQFGITDQTSFHRENTNSEHNMNAFKIFEHFFGNSAFRNNGFDTFTFNTQESQSYMNEPQQSLRKGKSIEYDLFCTLEELYHGCEKKMSIKRKVNDNNETEIIKVYIKRGWQEGTKVTFENKGDKLPNIVPGDIIFIIREKPHPKFTRQKNDLVLTHEITLKEAQNGFELKVFDINNQSISRWVKPLKTSEDSEIFTNRGMIITRGRGYGNLRVRFKIIF